MRISVTGGAVEKVTSFWCQSCRVKFPVEDSVIRLLLNKGDLDIVYWLETLYSCRLDYCEHTKHYIDLQVG